jgi:hypothetical protein
MTKEMISRCGFYCALCPWSEEMRKSIKTEEEFETLKVESKMYIGYTPMKITCQTCMTPDEELEKGVPVPTRSCLIRKCTIYNGIDNCAYCSRYPCSQIKSHITSDTDPPWYDKECIKEKLGEEFSEENYEKYLSPFFGLKHLDEIHGRLKESQIVDPKPPPPLKHRIVNFPEGLENPEVKILHKTLSHLFKSDLGLEDFDVYAGNERWKNRRRSLATVFWTLGKSGTIKDGVLKVSAEKYMKEKHTKAPTMKQYFDIYSKILKKQGIKLQFIPLSAEDEYQVPMGYLRNKGWAIEMSFNKKAGGEPALAALRKYIKKLEKKYGKRAFSYFSKLDMRNL